MSTLFVSKTFIAMPEVEIFAGSCLQVSDDGKYANFWGFFCVNFSAKFSKLQSGYDDIGDYFPPYFIRYFFNNIRVQLLIAQ